MKPQSRSVRFWAILPLLLLLLVSPAWAGDLPTQAKDRAAIERVYHGHRLGEKPPFEQAMPPSLLEGLVKEDLRKEAALKRAYGVEITSVLLDAEVRRINAATRAPEILAEIKTALGNDPARFMNALAKPILVERLLREKFENDEALHFPQRQQVEQARQQLLAAKQVGADYDKLLVLLRRSHSNALTETTWQLAARHEDKPAPAIADEMEIKKRFGPNAQMLSSPPAAEQERKSYFADLPGPLQNVLRAQLRQPGDVSAVIETPGGFLLYLAKEKTDTVLSVAGLSLPKRSYEQWLADQAHETK